MRVFTREPGHDRRSSDRWAQWVSVLLGTVVGFVGVAVLVSEVGYRLATGLELIDVADRTLWGLWRSVFVFTACGLVSAAFLAGSPVDLGKDALRALIGKIGRTGE